MMPALQPVYIPKGLQQMKMKGVKEMHIPASWGKCVGVHWLSPQAVVPPCLAVRKQQMGIAADKVEDADSDLHLCAGALSLKEKEVAAVTTTSQLPGGPLGS